MMGAHVLRAGVNRQIIDLMERGFIDHIAMNGAGVIHDYELARIGATTESVARYIRTGEFGLWRETGELNDWVREAAERLGLGENAGRRIAESDYPHRDLSVLAAAGARTCR
jgi:D-aminopeptidase